MMYSRQKLPSYSNTRNDVGACNGRPAFRDSVCVSARSADPPSQCPLRPSVLTPKVPAPAFSAGAVPVEHRSPCRRTLNVHAAGVAVARLYIKPSVGAHHSGMAQLIAPLQTTARRPSR
jgi:hypothetical protein